ncbi:MAG: histidine kinase [Chloroflexi bacterium]|nr:histidine kinase [Chloroflexota bacterium]
MYRSDSPYLVDWYVISLRWLVIVGTTAALGFNGSLWSVNSILLVVLTGWNISLLWLATQSRRLKFHRQISIAVDLGLAALSFWLAGSLFSPAAFMLALPLFSAGLYFNTLGGLSAAGVIILLEIADFLIRGDNIFVTGLGALVTLALGGTFGFISQQAYNQLQEDRKRQLASRDKQQKVDTDRLRAIYNMSSALTATLSYQRVLDTALDLSANALHVEDIDPRQKTVPADAGLSSAVLLFKGEELMVGSARRFTQSDLRASFPAKEGILAKIIEEGEPAVTGSLANDPELGRVIGFSQCQSFYCLPMRSGLSVYGAMIFGHPTPGYFSRERCDILAIVGRQAVIAIQNARLYQDLADEKERMVEVQEEARKKLARDLHDGPTQSVAAMAMRVSLARRMLERDPKAAAEELEKIEDLARRTTKEIRHMLFTLRPLVLESQGLTAALQANAEKMKETYGQEVIIQVDEKLAGLIEMGKSGVIFYIVEEAVNNARKHAKAPHIWVRLRPLPKQPDIAFLEIADDGEGFDVAAVNKSYDKRGSLGMVNLRERTELVNGILRIDSAPGKGAKIQVFIPLSEDAADLLHNAREQQQKQPADSGKVK